MTVYLDKALTRSQEISLGLVDGVSSAGFYGEGTAMDATGVKAVDIWNSPTAGGSLYTGFIDVATTISIVSDSIEDDTGVLGASQVEVIGLDGNGDFADQIYPLDGTNPIVTTHLWWRVFRMKNVGPVGTNGVNVGTITANSTGAGTPLMSRIKPKQGQSATGIWTIPVGHTGLASINLLNSRFAGAGGPSAIEEVHVHLLTKAFGEAQAIRYAFWVPTNGAPISLPLEEVLQIDELTDVWMQGAEASATEISVDAAMAFTVVRDA